MGMKFLSFIVRNVMWYVKWFLCEIKIWIVKMFVKNSYGWILKWGVWVILFKNLYKLIFVCIFLKIVICFMVLLKLMMNYVII